MGVVRNGNQWLLRNDNSAGPPEIQFEFGKPGDIPVVGDWDGDGVFGIGVRKADRFIWELRETASPGAPDRRFRYGKKTDIPITGDWNGDGSTGVGAVRELARTDAKPTTEWRLRHTADAGFPRLKLYFGTFTPRYVAADWLEDGISRPGFVRDDGRWRLFGAADPKLSFGQEGDIPVTWQAGEWTPGQLPG